MTLSRDEVMAKVREHLSAELEVDAGRIGESTRFREDLDADSLDLLRARDGARGLLRGGRAQRARPPRS